MRKLSRMFTVAASLSVPFFTIVTRKAYGLGAALYLPYISPISPLYLPYISPIRCDGDGGRHVRRRECLPRVVALC